MRKTMVAYVVAVLMVLAMALPALLDISEGSGLCED
jgi:hypothetical protein